MSRDFGGEDEGERTFAVGTHGTDTTDAVCVSLFACV